MCLLPFFAVKTFFSSLHTGAIAIDGGVFVDDSVLALIGSVDCNGNENNLLECLHLTEGDKIVSQCDPREKAAVACQGKCIF